MYADDYQGMSARPLALTAAGSGRARQHPLARQPALAPAAQVPAAQVLVALVLVALVLVALVPAARNRLPGRQPGLQPGRRSRRSGSSPRQRQSH
jgi:hypothetical protein